MPPTKEIPFLQIEVSFGSEPADMVPTALGSTEGSIPDPPAERRVPSKERPAPAERRAPTERVSSAARAVSSEHALPEMLVSEAVPSPFADELAGRESASSHAYADASASTSGSGDVSSTSRSGTGRASAAGTARSHRAKHEARLMPGSAACSDLFPHESRVARTELTVTLAVDPEGHAKLVYLDRNHPLVGQFAPAAQACTKRLRFAPARDAGGDTMASIAKVKLVFRRES